MSHVMTSTTMVPSPIPPRLPVHASLVPPASALHGQAPTSATITPTSREILHFCFCVPFHFIPGPKIDDVILSTPGALERWTLPPASEGLSHHKLPVHQKNLEELRRICRTISERDNCKASVVVSEPRQSAMMKRKMKKRGAVMNVSLAGDPEIVYSMRGYILQSLPVALRCSSVDIERELFYQDNQITLHLHDQLNDIAAFAGVDIFAMKPRQDVSPLSVEINDTSQAERLRILIYGDSESVELAKTRVLIMIDDLLKQVIHATFLNVSITPLVSGRARKNIKLVESTTRTAIYFPPQFPGVFGYRPSNIPTRFQDQIFITGSTREDVLQAEKMLTEFALASHLYVKNVSIGMLKADYIILERLDDVKKIMEANGTFVQFPVLGAAKGIMRVQGAEAMYVEKTIKQIMQITSQFYNASWWLLGDQTTTIRRQPTDKDIQQMLTDISTYSGAEISYNKNGFEIHGSDEAVKAALEIANEVKFIKQGAYQIRVKIELANEHKEFVAGKKNGKINKIMGQSNVQVMFDGFNEYNFYICVVGSKYEPSMLGLELVEQELPAAVSFYVPDQYHKRIIGIQGAHIQRLMKKYSVYVKFLNPTERESGTGGWLDADLVGDNNVVIRTPARNAANLELVKNEIMDTVQKVDAEIVTENVVIPRLCHRSLIANFTKLNELEKKWSCQFIFPSNEDASDVVVVKGPEWQLPDAINEFLALVPEHHKIQLHYTRELGELVKQEEFRKEVIFPIKERFSIEVQFLDERNGSPDIQTVNFMYTRNNSGNLQDAIDFLTSRMAKFGINSEPVKGAIPRPKSDSFEESFPFFNSKILQSTPAPIDTEEARRLSGEVNASTQAELRRMLNEEAAESAFHSKPPGSAGSSGSSHHSHHSFSFDAQRQSRSQRHSISSTGSAVWGPTGSIHDGEDWENISNAIHNSVTSGST